MAFSGGVYTLPTPALVPGQTVSSSENNTVRNDMAASFNLTMLRNGTSTATANLPMGGYKLTGLGAATTSGDALSYGAAAVVTTLTSTSLTATRVPYAGTGGLLQDASTFTFDGTTLTAGGFTTSGAISAGTITASGAITVSGGTANGVAYLNGSKVLTTGSALTFDGTNLGVGVSSANGKLNVATSTGKGFEFYPDNSSGTNLVLNYDRTGGVYQNLAVRAATHQWFIDASEQMRLTSTGLGIGTSSPSAKLDIAGNANIKQFVSAGNGVTDGYLGYSWNRNLASGALFDNAKNAYDLLMQPGSNNLFLEIYAPGGSPVSGTALVMTPSGNLGLGVTPSAWGSSNQLKALQVSTRAAFVGLDSGTPYTVVANNWYVNSSNVDTYIGSGNATSYVQVSGQHRFYTAPSGTAGNAITFTQAMTLDASGNLGIGTSSPGNKLDVVGNIGIKSAGALKLYNAANNATSELYSDATGLTQFSHTGVIRWLNDTATTERMRIDSSGNVGIGTSSPNNYGGSYKTLQVTGGSTSNGGVLRLTNSDSSRGGHVGIDTATMFINTFTSTPITFGTADTERMRIDSSGNVGIGTSSPYSGGGVKTLQLTSSDYSIFEQSVTTATAGYQNWRQIVRGSVGGHVYQLQLMNDANSAEQTIYEVSRTANSVAYQRWYAGTSEAMRIDSSGNLLVGNTSSVQSSRAEFTSSSLTPALLARVNVASDESQWAFQIQKTTTTNTTAQVFTRFLINNGSTPSGYITANGANQATFTSTSDARLKKNIVDIEPQLNNVLALRPVEFDYIDGSGHQTGFIAQEMQQVYPDSVSEGFDGMLQIGGWSKTEARLVKAIQELKAELDATKAEVAALKGK